MTRSTSPVLPVLVLMVATWLALPAQADLRVDTLLDKWDRQLAGGNMVSCRIRQEKRIFLLRDPIQLEGRFYFMYPDCFRVELNGDENFAVYSDGRSICVVDHDLDEVRTYDQGEGTLPQDTARLVHPLAGRTRKEILAANVIEYDRSKQEYVMTPRSAGATYAVVNFRVDHLERLVWVRVSYANGDWSETEFSRWRRHDRVSRHFFRYRGPTDNAAGTDPG